MSYFVLGKRCLAYAKAGILRPWGLSSPFSCSAFNPSYNRLSTSMVCAGCDCLSNRELAALQHFKTPSLTHFQFLVGFPFLQIPLCSKIHSPPDSSYIRLGQSVNQSMPILSIQNAAGAGLLRNDSDPSQVSGFCPTANCTWEPYDSLALCSTVEDFTSGIILECLNDTSQSCNISTAALKAAGSPDISLSLSCLGCPPDPFLAVSNIDGYVISNGSTIWLDVFVFYAFYNHDFPSMLQTGKNLFALKSRLSPCLQKLQTIMNNGATHTIVRDSQDQPNLQAGFYGPNGNYSGFESFFNWVGSKQFNVTADVEPKALASAWGDTPNPFVEALFGPNADTFDPKLSEQGFRDRMSNFTTIISNA